MDISPSERLGRIQSAIGIRARAASHKAEGAAERRPLDTRRAAREAGTVTVPKHLRPYFLHNREPLGTLSQEAWQTVAEMVDMAASGNELERPGMVTVIHPRDLLAQIPDLFRDRGRECNVAGPTAISTRSLSTNRVGPLIVSLMMPPQRRGLSLQAERRRTSENPTPS